MVDLGQILYYMNISLRLQNEKRRLFKAWRGLRKKKFLFKKSYWSQSQLQPQIFNPPQMSLARPDFFSSPLHWFIFLVWPLQWTPCHILDRTVGLRVGDRLMADILGNYRPSELPVVMGWRFTLVSKDPFTCSELSWDRWNREEMMALEIGQYSSLFLYGIEL